MVKTDGRPNRLYVSVLPVLKCSMRSFYLLFLAGDVIIENRLNWSRCTLLR